MTSIVTDIMGTIIPIAHADALMDYFLEHGVSYLNSADEDTLTLVEKIKRESGCSDVSDVLNHVGQQIKNGIKNPDNFELAGLLHMHAYTSGALKAEVFDDVPDAFNSWKKNQNNIYLFSNGSKEFQNSKNQ